MRTEQPTGQLAHVQQELYGRITLTKKPNLTNPAGDCISQSFLFITKGLSPIGQGIPYLALTTVTGIELVLLKIFEKKFKSKFLSERKPICTILLMFTTLRHVNLK